MACFWTPEQTGQSGLLCATGRSRTSPSCRPVTQGIQLFASLSKSFSTAEC